MFQISLKLEKRFASYWPKTTIWQQKDGSTEWWTGWKHLNAHVQYIWNIYFKVPFKSFENCGKNWLYKTCLICSINFGITKGLWILLQNMYFILIIWCFKFHWNWTTGTHVTEQKTTDWWKKNGRMEWYTDRKQYLYVYHEQVQYVSNIFAWFHFNPSKPVSCWLHKT